MPHYGQFTPAIKSKMDAFMGRETSQAEFRLLPYIQYQMVNEQEINPGRINRDDRAVLALWREQGHLGGGMPGLAITKQFWDFICEIVFLGYVAYREQEEADLFCPTARTELKQLRHAAEAKDAYGVKTARDWEKYYRTLDATRTPFLRIATRYALPVSVAILFAVTAWVART